MERVNLLPWRQALARRQRRAWNCRVGTLLIGLLGAGIAADQQLRYWIRQQHGRQRTQQYSPLPASQQLAAHRLPRVSPRQQRHYPLLQLLDKLPRQIPPGIYLQQLHWQPPQMTLQGSALSYSRLAGFIDTLHRDHATPPLQLSQATTEETQPAGVQFCLQGYWPEKGVVADDRR